MNYIKLFVRDGNVQRWCLALMILIFSLTAAAQQDGFDDQRPYPQGTRFPLGLYSIHTVEEMKDARKSGWNMAHRYGFKIDFLKVVAL